MHNFVSTIIYVVEHNMADVHSNKSIINPCPLSNYVMTGKIRILEGIRVDVEEVQSYLLLNSLKVIATFHLRQTPK